MPYISMEYVRGVTLRYLLDQTDRLPYSAGLRLAKQLCAGLGAAHAVGVLHRDIKPENLILEPTGNAKLMDFGIARPIDAHGRRGRPRPAASSARRSTWRPSSSRARRPTRAPTSTPAASCSTRSSPASCRSTAPNADGDHAEAPPASSRRRPAPHWPEIPPRLEADHPALPGARTPRSATAPSRSCCATSKR